MRWADWKRPDLSSVLDAFTSRFGFGLAVSGLVLTCIFAALSVESSIRQLEEDQEIFRDRQMRNGFVSMSDIQRLLLVVKEAEAQGGFSAELRTEFVQAVDILFVRKDNFRRVLRAGDTLASAETAIRSLEGIVDIADRAMADNFADVQSLKVDLLAASETARRDLVLFLDDMNRMQDSVLQDQADAVGQQRSVTLASLAGLTIFGIIALLLLQREVLARQARERAERDVEFLAFFDPLTRLPNRSQFQRRLGEALAQAGPVALVLVDLDDFKGINDTYGHSAGDAVLCHVAGLLSERAKPVGGFAARIGGDEFAMVLPTDDLDVLNATGRLLLEDAEGHMDFDGEAIVIGFSVGLATNTQLGPDLASTVDALSRVTDFALYASKAGGRRRYTLYDEGLERKFLERRTMIEELPKAIADGSLQVFLQPKVILDGRRIYGFEALVRWNRRGRLVPPDDFITVAEEGGLIIEIDRYVLRSASSIVAAFNRDHGTDYSVSVNLSALHFSSRRIIGWINEALEESALPPDLLTLEITETVELRDWRQAWDVIAGVRDLGAKISIDDFGTGYSSLGYLRTTIADELKIDRSLVEQVETSDRARFLLDGVLDMAQNLEIETVVEGVETEAQARTLIDMGANCAQGFLFGRPEPASSALSRAFATNPRRTAAESARAGL
jgi:diguanylate cyclase (GGDEF)-like protein